MALPAKECVSGDRNEGLRRTAGGLGRQDGRLGPVPGGPCMASLASRFYLEAVKAFDPTYDPARARL